MAVDLRTMGPGGWNSLAGNLQWKNGVGSDPTPRPQAPVCRLLRGGALTGSDEYGTAHAEHFCGAHPFLEV